MRTDNGHQEIMVDKTSFGTLLSAIARRDEFAIEKAGSYRQIKKTAMGETQGVLGGYLVPPEYTAKLLGTVFDVSIVLPRANVIDMGSAQKIAPMIDVVTAQVAGVNPFAGSMQFTWGWQQTPPETEPKFRALELNAWDLLGECVVSNQWLADTPAEAEEYLLEQFARAAAWYVEYAFFRGAGTPKLMPLGILNAPGTISTTRTTPNLIKATDIANMAGNLLPHSWANAVWVVSAGTAMAQVIALSTFVVNQQPTTGGKDGNNALIGYLLGRPCFVSDKLPVLGTAGDLTLFDPSMYVVGMRQEVLVDTSDTPNFFTNQTDFRVWMRLDGRPQLSDVITSSNGTTFSPFVILAA